MCDTILHLPLLPTPPLLTSTTAHTILPHPALPPPAGTVLQEPLLQPLASDEATGRAFELPSINPTCRGRPYHFAYGACCVRPTNCWNALCKVDTHSGEVRWVGGLGCTLVGGYRGPAASRCCSRHAAKQAHSQASCLLGPLPSAPCLHLPPSRTWHEPGGATWEPFFVPRPGGRAEDDGVVMSTIMQADGRRQVVVELGTGLMGGAGERAGAQAA